MSNIPAPGPLTFKDYMHLDKYGIPPTYGIPLMIVSAASPKYIFNQAQICGGSLSGGAVTLWGAQPGPNVFNGMWQLTPEGRIVWPYNLQLAIGIVNGQTVMVALSDSDATQIWEIQAASGGIGYTIYNSNSDQYWQAPPNQTVGYNGGNGNYGSGLITMNAANNAVNQVWIFLPPTIIPPNSFYIQSALPTSGEPGQATNPLVIQYNSSSNQFFVSPWSPGIADQLFRFNTDGSISQANDPAESSILTSTSTNGKSNSPLNFSPKNGAPTDLQTWTFDPAVNNFLTVTSAATGTLSVNVPNNEIHSALITWTTNGAWLNSVWYVFPAQSTVSGEWFYLQTTLNQNDKQPPGPAYVLTVASGSPVASTPVQINQLQSGALTQLWQLTPDGSLISAIDQTLVLTANTNGPATLQLPVAGANVNQQYWCVMPNGMLAARNGTTAQYLSVLKSIDPSQPASAINPPMTNGEVTVYDYFSANNNTGPNVWNILTYEPDMSGQWFTIESVNENEATTSPYLLTVSDDWKAVGIQPPLGGNILPYGSASINQLWRFTLDGSIVSAVNTGLYLTGNSNGDVRMAPAGAPNQQWAWGETWKMPFTHINKSYNFQSAVLMNTSLQLALYTQYLGTSSYVGMTTSQSPASSYPNQCWYIAPVNPAYNQPTTIRNQGGSGKVPGLFLQLQEAGTTDTYNITIGERGSEVALSTWVFIYPGYIASSVNNDIVLGMAGTPVTNKNNTAILTGATTYGPNVCASLRATGYQAFQLWEATQEGVLINKQTGTALTLIVDNSTTPATYTLSTTAYSPSDTNLPYWDFAPGQALQTVLVIPPVTFPVPASGSADEQDAYDQICENLGLPGGIRTQYQNLAAPLSSYQLAIHLMPVPLDTTGVPSVAWLNVVNQLSNELTRVIAIQQFFTQANTFHESLTQAQALLVSELITACAFPNGQGTPVAPPKKRKAWIWDMFEGLLYTGLNAAGLLVGDPEAGKELSMGKKFIKNGLPVLANLISGASSTTQSVMQNKTPANNKYSQALQNAYNYELSVFQLQQSLLNLFETIGSMLGKMQMVILADWGKISAVYDMIKNTGSIDSLYWPASMTPVMVQQMLAGYATKVLQTLIPANTQFYINGYLHNASGNGLQEDQLTFYGKNLDGTTSQWVAVINADVMSQVWNYGTNPNDFYRQLNGWDIWVKYPYGSNTQGYQGSAALIITFYNETCVPMELDLSGMKCTFGPSSMKLPAYGAAQFAGFDYNNTINLSGPAGTYVITEESAPNNNVLNGTLSVYNAAFGDMPSFSNGMTFTAPYYMIRGTKTAPYVVNMTFYTIHISMRPS
jgi:hypothetical protein